MKNYVKIILLCFVIVSCGRRFQSESECKRDVITGLVLLQQDANSPGYTCTEADDAYFIFLIYEFVAGCKREGEKGKPKL